MFVDFHTHTTASDGTYKPEDLVKKAKSIGIEIIALTDHDTVSGFNEIDDKFDDDPVISVIKGVEISVEYPTDSLHILGYNFKDFETVGKVLNELIDFRNRRNDMILKKMNDMGFAANMEEVKRIAKGKAVGRPHFARLMVEKGYVKSIDEAFQRYLKDGAPLFVEKKRLKPKEAIELIKSAGGVAIMAHPYNILDGLPLLPEGSPDSFEGYIIGLVKLGLDGLEVFYSTHTMAQTDELLRIAKKYDLLMTAGSDFHGDNKPSVRLGMNTPYKYLRKFLSKLG
ncbi:MAG TPA: PHP domain-containing protein [Fervidobacterium sp.]|nr:PHP domain-containing protein [Fervidobacterium sp.]HOQ39809.1 PHP domain-containing protein [Fervidobacterium sp.]HPT54315.1 PHP domain-containing protein [Fervidobacterium sp.]HPZ17780.1 PHP domain-containing protein [Fervidobacterium sp.]HQE48922.1 PHP domain-containing protein [Fervidobacterium sp.]